MAALFTTNLRLFLSPDLTPEARANLERIDTLGVSFQLTSSGDVLVRSVQDIIIEPEAASIGGSGTGGTVTIGTASHTIDSTAIYADTILLNGDVTVQAGKTLEIDGNLEVESLRLQDDANDNYIALQAPSSMSANLTYTLPGVDGSANQVLKTDGAGTLSFTTVATASLSQNRVNVGSSLGIATETNTSTLGDILADTVTGLTIKAGIIVDADVNAAAALTLSKLAALTASRALQSDGSGVISASSVTNTELSYVSGVTSALQTQLNAKQPLDSTLTSLAAYNTNGLLTQTAADTFTGRTLTASTGISISNGDGVAGNPTISSTITQYTDEMAQDAVGTILTDTSSVDFTYNDAGNTISAVVLPAGVDHDSLLNFVANKHIDHSAVSIITGATSGLSGGGNITASRTLLVAPELASSTTVASGDLILVADVSAANALSNVTAGSIAALGGTSFTATWLAADGTTKAITHSLGTRDIMVQVYDNTTFDTIYVDTVIRTSTSVVTLTSSEAPSVSWRVLIRSL